jgi:hypothetical protein
MLGLPTSEILLGVIAIISKQYSATVNILPAGDFKTAAMLLLETNRAVLTPLENRQGPCQVAKIKAYKGPADANSPTNVMIRRTPRIYR